jgi:LmbE family N-acetylglucosaminyl deacetylase
LLEKYLKKLKPEIIYTHHHGDRNIDHRISFDAVLTACRPVGDYSVKEIYAFETPSSTEWGFSSTNGIFYPNLFEDITDTIDNKLQAMSYYTSELNDFPHPRSLKALEIIAQRWGTVIGKSYAEAFEVIRCIR